MYHDAYMHFWRLIKPGILIFLTLTGLVVGTGCDSGATQHPITKINLTGSSTIAPLMAEVGKRYETANPGVRIDVQTGGSSRGIADAASGLADIGMSSRALKQSETAARTGHTVALDGIGILVNAANPVEALTDQQIIGIFTGEITNWGAVGGKDVPITVINRAEGRAELELFQKFYDLKPQDFKADLISGENQHGIKTVANDINAIIYMSVGASEFDIANGTNIKLLPLRGIPASSETIHSGQYPLSRPLILVTKPDPSPAIQEFLNFALSDQVHDLVKQQSYVPVENHR